MEFPTRGGPASEDQTTGGYSWWPSMRIEGHHEYPPVVWSSEAGPPLVGNSIDIELACAAFLHCILHCILAKNP